MGSSEMKMDDLELLSYASENSCNVSEAILDHLREMEKGIEIDGTYYDYEEIRECL
jgi:hypothetical protein